MTKFIVKFMGISVLIILIAMLMIFNVFDYVFDIGPKPEIEYGEFPCYLKYEVDGKVYEVNDSVVCKFDGFSVNEAVGLHRKWKSYLKSGEKWITLFENEKEEIFFSPCISSNFTGAEYMGDIEISDVKPSTIFPHAYYMEKSKPEDIRHIWDTELLAKYNIKLIEWKQSEPIKNNFK